MESNKYPGTGGTPFNLSLNSNDFATEMEKLRQEEANMARKLLDEGKISMEEYTQILNQL